MLRIAALCLILPALAHTSCTIRDGNGITARIKMRNGELDIDLQNSKMQTGEWTAVAFGPDMSDLELYLFDLKGARVSAHSGASTGYEAPTLDSSSLESVRDSSYSSGTLHARFSRALKGAGPRKHDLESCAMVALAYGPMEGDSVGAHYDRPYQTRVCFAECK